MNPWEKGILWIIAGLTVAVLARLWSRGLMRVYKRLCCYLAADFLTSVVALTVPYNTKLYALCYVVGQTLKVVLAAFVLVEIYTIVLERTPALAHFVKNSIWYILGAAALIPILTLLIEAPRSSQPYFEAFLSFERTMDGTMAIFLILVSIFMTWFPVRIRRNAAAYMGGFIVWALSRSAAVHLVKLWSANAGATQAVNTVLMVVELGCLFVWLVGFQREGEVQTAVVGHLWNRAEAERLTEQLDAINNSLERLRRR